MKYSMKLFALCEQHVKGEAKYLGHLLLQLRPSEKINLTIYSLKKECNGLVENIDSRFVLIPTDIISYIFRSIIIYFLV